MGSGETEQSKPETSYQIHLELTSEFRQNSLFSSNIYYKHYTHLNTDYKNDFKRRIEIDGVQLSPFDTKNGLSYGIDL